MPEERVVDTRAHPDVSCADLTTRAMPGVTEGQPLQDGPKLWRARISKASGRD